MDPAPNAQPAESTPTSELLANAVPTMTTPPALPLDSESSASAGSTGQDAQRGAVSPTSKALEEGNTGAIPTLPGSTSNDDTMTPSEEEEDYNEEIIVDSPPTPPPQPAPQTLPITPVAPTPRATAPASTDPISTAPAPTTGQPTTAQPIQLNSFPNYTSLGYPTSGTAAYLFPSGEIVISPNQSRQQPSATVVAARQWTDRQQNESAGLYFCPYRASPYTPQPSAYHHPYSRSSLIPAPMLYDHPLSAPPGTSASAQFQARHPCHTPNAHHLWEYSQMPQVLPPPLMGMLSPMLYSNHNNEASCPNPAMVDPVRIPARMPPTNRPVTPPPPQTSSAAEHPPRR